MIVDNGAYYLYRHIRLDKNEPFYIGIGKKNRIYDPYFRSKDFRPKSRNVIWNSIYRKTEIEVEILLESNDMNFIKDKEQEFINKYGMISRGTGILSNIVKGGYGGYGKSRDAVIRNMDRYIASCLAMAEKNKGRNGCSVLSRGGFAYNLNGDFCFEFKTGIQAQNIIGNGCKSYNVIRKIDTRCSYYDYFFTSFKHDKLDTTNYRVNPVGKCYAPKKVAKLNNNGDLVEIYNTVVLAAKINNINHDALSKAIKAGKPTRKAGLFKFVDENNNIKS